ncbi:hypothetical protein, partial [Streptomyces sp. NPDC005827]|uniref:hypothetical protein n=1 Tax=Streptomyces sp. NPDC005827 TaxID=3157070 RepID=UPI0033E10AAD
FDSVPHDLGAYFTVQQLPEGVPLTVDGFVIPAIAGRPPLVVSPPAHDICHAALRTVGTAPGPGPAASMDA